MNKKVQFIQFLVGALLLCAVEFSFAGPGYVSRDCPGFGAKESISVDWSGATGVGGEWFYTLSYHVRKDSSQSSGYRWEKHTSGSNWVYIWRSYAGQVGNWLDNYYYAGVYGIHYWYNQQAKRTETRRRFVTDCNLESWGHNNW